MSAIRTYDWAYDKANNLESFKTGKINFMKNAAVFLFYFGRLKETKEVYAILQKDDKTVKYPPFPVFEGEKFFPLSHLYYQIDQDYSLWILNRPLKKIEYHSDGLSANIYLQYWNNPRGFAYYRIQEMKVAPTFKRLATVCVHYVASCIRSRDKRWLSNSPCKGLTCLCAPLGALLYLFIRYKVKNNRKYQVKY